MGKIFKDSGTFSRIRKLNLAGIFDWNTVFSNNINRINRRQCFLAILIGD